jgi:LuxR family maltose regulon positive regulatory protein
MARGLTNPEIAEELVISPHTVRTHATHIYAKLAVKNRARAVRKARQLGMLP